VILTEALVDGVEWKRSILPKFRGIYCLRLYGRRFSQAEKYIRKDDRCRKFAQGSGNW